MKWILAGGGFGPSSLYADGALERLRQTGPQNHFQLVINVLNDGPGYGCTDLQSG